MQYQVLSPEIMESWETLVNMFVHAYGQNIYVETVNVEGFIVSLCVDTVID